MFSFAVLALASIASSVTALVIPRSSIPSTYNVAILEDYHIYHKRYMALDCESKHNTTFFNDCCHPMLATENLKDNRKPYCTPSHSAASSAAQAEPTATDVPSGDDDCDDDESSSAADPTPTSVLAPANVAPAPAHPAPSPSPSPSPSSSDKPKPATTSSPDTPKPSSSSGNNGGGAGGLAGVVGQIFHGTATFFYQNGVAGNCGTVHQDSDSIVALETSMYANGAHCGKTVILKNDATGHVEEAIVADSCPTCVSTESVDMSAALFNKFAESSQGTFSLSWGFK